MKFCADIAEEAGLPTFLTALPEAYDMYLKFGYTDVGLFEMDINNYGKKTPRIWNISLVRDAAATRNWPFSMNG
jgi:hypothetical protein